MAHHLPTQPRPRMPVRPVQYLDPATQQMVYLTSAQFAAKQRQDAILYARWRQRRAAQRARDRKLRRFWLGFGVVIGVAVLAGFVLVSWLIWQALAAVSLGVLAVPVVILFVALLGVGGHRCVTVVQHWH
jgi:sterol desaturase/sphingolipid hydroxylase (fatty acid hydroxylase superfamily)